VVVGLQHIHVVDGDGEGAVSWQVRGKLQTTQSDGKAEDGRSQREGKTKLDKVWDRYIKRPARVDIDRAAGS